MARQRTTHIPQNDNLAALRDLQHAVREHQRAKRAADALDRYADPGGRPVVTNLQLAMCECSRQVRVAPSMLAAGEIACGICSTPFRLVDR
jgi:hypothetical protein